MKVYTFTINLKKSKQSESPINGVLIDFGTHSTIQLSKVIFKKFESNLKEFNIKNPKNFIASLIIRFDKDEMVDSFTFEDQKVKIEREFDAGSSKTETYYYLEGIKEAGSSEDLLLTGDETFTIGTESGLIYAELKASDPILKLKSFIAPKDFMYTKNTDLNHILKVNKTPFCFDRSLCKKIIDAIGKNKEILNTNQEYVYFHRYNERKLILEDTTKNSNQVLFKIPVSSARNIAGLK